MIQAFKPKRLGFYTMFILFVVLFFGQNLAILLPAILLLISINGFESFYSADIDKIYNRVLLSEVEKVSIFKSSLFFGIFAILSAFYFGFPIWYISFLIIAIFGASLVHHYHFISDFILSLIMPLLLMVHSLELISISPVYWFVFFYELIIRSNIQLNRPFGIEKFTLPKILGVDAARKSVMILCLLGSVWPLLLAKYSGGLTFILMSVSSMLIAASVYALKILHVDDSRYLVRISALVFLLGLFSLFI